MNHLYNSVLKSEDNECTGFAEPLLGTHQFLKLEKTKFAEY